MKKVVSVVGVVRITTEVQLEKEAADKAFKAMLAYTQRHQREYTDTAFNKD